MGVTRRSCCSMTQMKPWPIRSFSAATSHAKRDRLLPGQASPFYELTSQAKDCNGDDTAAFTVVFESDDLLLAAPGIYTGFLTLTVAAE